MKKFLNPWKISYKTKYFSISFSIENEKKWPLPLSPIFFFFGGGSSAGSPLEIWDVMPPYLKALFEQNTEIW